VRIKQQNDQISSFREPRHNFGKIVSTIGALLFTRQNTWRINERDGTQDTGGELRSLEATQEGDTEAFEAAKGQIGVNRQRISWNRSFFWAINEDGETVRGGFRSDSLTRKVSSEEVANEASLSDTVLTNKENLRFG
jgi:hypothetical protein